MRYPTPIHLSLLLLILLCTCAPALNAQAQPTDTLIIVTKLPYPKARLPYPRPQRGQTPIAQGAGNGAADDGTVGSDAADNGTLGSSETGDGNRGKDAAGDGIRGKDAAGNGTMGSGKTAAGTLEPTQKSANHKPINPESCITIRHQSQLSTNLITLKEFKKGNWLKYLPAVSAGLGPALRQNQDGSVRVGIAPTFSVGLNSSLIYKAHQEKQQRAATREALIQRAQLQQQTEIAQLHRLQRRLQIEIDKLDLHAGVADIDRQLFTLYEKKYRNHEITPEEYLLKRKTFLTQELRNQDQITRIQTLQYQIEDLAGCITSPPAKVDFPSRK